ncbi:hypothetical protein HMPREF3037_03073 [Candidatus Stoquefichus sp. KLE1796]|nr:hypothetical protein HMPREF3037_03073 [Candidatus Stoquefichus sp. KLE1796]
MGEYYYIHIILLIKRIFIINNETIIDFNTYIKRAKEEFEIVLEGEIYI